MTAESPSAAPKRVRVDDRALAAARLLYEGEAEATQADIARKCGMSAGTLAYHARLNGWIRAEGARMHRTVENHTKRAKLVGRLYRAFERQVGELEERLGARLKARADGEGEPVDTAFDDRDARLLSTLAQTLSRLVTLDAAWSGGDASGRAVAADQEGDGNLDEFRRSLAQRLEALIESPDRGVAGEP
ncbi:hypothetical protein C8N35_110146 [Breoghania corrubedonensis]|uniref:Uncharacterized protein n=1 Tax=Breoghania corrubedonensis TaxID=665038 RepID=A0A2T5V1N1_9HYPH|nr:hypothetical protein [Breoghania corrubedonensis]PTW57667.1 hypothetical protein C8N35_110146 [Breoghania corrubedonensis]